MSGIAEGLEAIKVAQSGFAAWLEYQRAGRIQITSPRSQGLLEDKQPFVEGKFSYLVRGKLKRLPTRHEIWLLTQDEGSETAWPQGFSAVQFDRQSGDWSGRIGGKPGETVKIVAVVAPPTSVDFFRYYQNICNQGKEFEPLSRVPVECRNSYWVQTRFP